MNKSISVQFSRLLGAIGLFAWLGLLSAPASAVAPDPRMFGPWVVQQSVSPENRGLGVYFSPDGNFFLVDPKTQMGMNGTWVVGRVGLLVSIYGNGRWAKLWDADVAFDGANKMILDVKDSQIAPPQRFILLRLKP